MNIHVVKKGDTLQSIARRLGSDVEALAHVNQLSYPFRLSPGRSLIIPGPDFEPQRTPELFALFRPPVSNEALAEGLPLYTYCADCRYYFGEEGDILPPTASPLCESAGEHFCANFLYLANLNSAGGFSGSLAHRLFTDERLRAAVRENIFAALKEHSCQGLHLAFNYLFPFDRDNYSRFVSELSQLLHREGYLLSVELSPGDSFALSAGQDQKALGAFSDRLLLMCCRWGHSFSPPRPPAPMDALRESLELALSRVPAAKLLMGISGLGFDWPLPWRQGMRARAVSSTEAHELAAASGAEIFHGDSAHFDYRDAEGKGRRVYFEDAQSLYKKLRLMEEYSLAGAALYNAERLNRPLLYMLSALGGGEKLL